MSDYMAINPFVILAILAMVGTITTVGTLFLFIVLNVNVLQILKDLGGNKTSNDIEKIGDYMRVEDISPSKTTIVRIPHLGYEFQINKFVYCNNGQISLVQDDEILYTVNDESELVLDDLQSHLRGDEYSIYRVENNKYKNYMNDKLKYSQLNANRYKKMLLESFDDNKELLKHTSEMVRESRKSLYSQGQQQQPWNPLYRRPMMDVPSEGNEEF